MKKMIGSILHGAYGDLYEQAICLKHYAALHPEVEIKLFAATQTRLDSFRALDLSFASGFDLWTKIEEHPEIQRFFQFQVRDVELNQDVLVKLPQGILEKFDLSTNNLPWIYLRDNHLVPAPSIYQLPLSEYGARELSRISKENCISNDIWNRPTINFLWRYRGSRGAVRGFGQKTKEELVKSYSDLFKRLIGEFDCHVLICGMNIVTTDSNRAITDNKFPNFGLDLPEEQVTYLKGLSWPIELEIASRATICCGHASGFTEGLWLKRGRGMIMMDVPPHYLAKIAYRRMSLFDLNHPVNLASALFNRSAHAYHLKIESIMGNNIRRPMTACAIHKEI